MVLITGGSRGLGLALARAFAAEGAHLVLCARDALELDTAARELRARGTEVMTQTCDVVDRAQVEALVEQIDKRFGRLDVLVNNASIIQVGPLAAMSAVDFHHALAVNFWGTVHATLAALPLLRAGRGTIVNVTSIGGAVAVPHLIPYSCGKFAALGFSTGLRSELAALGVKVVTIVPGLMRTGSFLQALFKGDRAQELGWFALASSLPLLTLPAEKAARRIVLACRRGEPFVTLGVPAKLLRLFSALFPTATAAALELTARLLPAAGEGGAWQRAEPGWQHHVGSALTALGDRAARENNEVPAR